MSEETVFSKVFSSILIKNGIAAPLERLELKGLRDEPGVHWSSPGVKQVSAYAGGKRYLFVLKRLGEHSKREVLVYRFLSGRHGFPIPVLFGDVYNEDSKEYWMVIERCVGRDFDNPNDFWEQCGLLLARIHAVFWDRVNDLPGFFHMSVERDRILKAVDRLTGFLEFLGTQEMTVLEQELGFFFSGLRSALKRVNRERLQKLPEAGRCLLHGAFHSPEIMWRKTSGEYIPVGVDWERSRVGVPAEDLAFSVNDLLAKGEGPLFDMFLNTYLSEMSKYGIILSRDEVAASTRYENLVHTMMSVLPSLLPTFLRVRHDDEYTEWCRWIRQDMPYTLRFLQSEIESGHIYRE